MKKPLRILLIVCASLILVCVIAVVLVFTPGVQTWAAHKFAPNTAELSVGLGRVNAGLNQTRVENIRVVQPGLVLTIPVADVNVSVIDAAGGKIAVKRLVAKGWVLDLTAPWLAPVPASSPKPAEAARTAFNGIFNLIQLPFDLAVDGVDLSGEVILPNGRAQVSITGGGIAVGHDGKFVITGEFKASDSSVLSVHGDLLARMNTSRTFERFALAATAAASGPQLPAGAKIEVNLSAGRDEAHGEAYAAVLRAGSRNLVQLAINLPAGTAPLAGSWQLDVSTADVTPFALGRPLPDFTAKGRGAFSADRLFTQIKTDGSFDASIDKLDVIKPGFAALGRLMLAAGFDVAISEDLIRLTKFDVRVSGANPVASVSAVQVIEFNPKTGALTAADPAGDLLKITLDGLPLSWAKPFLGDLAVSGDAVRGAFTASAHDGGFAVRPAAPITITNLSISKAGITLVNALDVALSAQADYSPKGWTAEVSNFSVSSAAVGLLKVTAKAGQSAGDKQPLAASVTYEIDLPAVLAQPVGTGLLALSKGIARGELTASVADTQTISVILQLAELAATDFAALPTVALQARAVVDATGHINVQAPVVIAMEGRRSDITLGASLTPGREGMMVTAQLGGDTLNIPDLMLFSSLVPSKSVAAAPGKPATKAPIPTAPLWEGVSGELTFAFQKLIYSKDLQVTDMGGVIKLSPSALTLENIQAALKTGGKMKAGGGLKFDATQQQPYGLQADVALTNVDSAPLLRALSPGKPAQLEGKFDLRAQASGRAVDPSEFSGNALGDISLTSRGGTIRALSMKTGAAVDNAGKAAAIVGLFGSLTGNESTVKYADRTRAVADVTKQLAAITFTQLNVIAGRDAQNNFAIKDLTLLSPIVHLTGSGGVTYTEGLSLLQQPLLLTLKLGARDQLADGLRSLNLLNTEPDKEGYFAMTEDLKLDGTLQAVGTSHLSALLKRAITN
ncbi:MAG: hypothetical protein WC205_03405 [Opitutaceae bacterium]|jgi:hypothetical protein